jgi:hypothetical protein
VPRVKGFRQVIEKAYDDKFGGGLDQKGFDIAAKYLYKTVSGVVLQAYVAMKRRQP